MAKILIIEDDPLISRMYESAFKFEGFEVDFASDGKEGLAKIQKDMPTLVLLDIMMPVMNGLEVLSAVEADPKTKSIPVIVLTNLSGTADAEKAIALGAVKYIIKSQYKPKQVVDMVKEILSAYTRSDLPKVKPSA